VDFITGTGRVGRLQYFATYLALSVAVILSVLLSASTNEVTGQTQVGPLVFLVGPVATYLGLTNAIRRLHDLGRSGWLILLAFVPIVSLGLALYLLFVPGDRGRNRFGLPPGTRETLVATQSHRNRMARIQAEAAEAYAERQA
jgi:uncharacterized membrane protein YhaH (DUF805 family)